VVVNPESKTIAANSKQSMTESAPPIAPQRAAKKITQHGHKTLRVARKQR